MTSSEAQVDPGYGHPTVFVLGDVRWGDAQRHILRVIEA
jgi:hypothetical protein